MYPSCINIKPKAKKQTEENLSCSEIHTNMIDMSMEQSSFGSKRHDGADFNLERWTVKARIGRENASCRRLSASNLMSFREEQQRERGSCFKSNVTISSTASSPGYTIRDKIDPTTYSFTTALKALQAKTWEYLSPDDGYTLNSKWNDAEKYICNPLSGQVPLECLSAKTLSARSFRTLTLSRIAMSAPLIYPSNHVKLFHPKSPTLQRQDQLKFAIQEEKRGATRDVGTQSTSIGVRSGSPSPVQTPSIEERTTKRCEAEDSSDGSTGKLKSGAEDFPQVEVKEKSEKREKQYTERNGGRERKKVMWRCCSNR